VSVEKLIEKNVGLAPLTWWKVGGSADLFASPRTKEDVAGLLEWAHARGMPITVLGGGTNVLISDRGIDGLVISMRSCVGASVREEDGRVMIEALAGTPKAELTKNFLRLKLAPALFLCGLPGDVGGGVVMNAGVSEKIEPREFVEIVDSIEVAKMEDDNRAEVGSSSARGGKARIVRYSKEDLVWHYRHTEGWQPGVVVSVTVSWPLNVVPDIQDQVRKATRTRLERQPLNLPSCGSVFKNPPDDKSGRLIEAAGLKGYTVGGAQVSMKHANFIVNVGGSVGPDGRSYPVACASDCDAVLKHVQSTVRAQFGVSLVPEVKYLGRW